MDDEASILSERVMTRWEALEACEKIFHGTRVRVSADNVGLARHPDGLELVWIGEPLRQEFAAWTSSAVVGNARPWWVLASRQFSVGSSSGVP